MEITDLKQRLTITQVARSLGITIGKNHKAHCPFHDDKIPSLQFSEEKGICTCFSSNCNAGTMDIIGLTEKKLNVNTHEALKYLTKLAGGESAVKERNNKPMPGANTGGTNEPEDISRISVLQKAWNYFEQNFIGSIPAKKYARDTRGLDIQRLAIGYNGGRLHYKENARFISSLESVGLLGTAKNGAGHHVFGRGCLVFPLKNKQNQVSGFYFRMTDPPPADMVQYMEKLPAGEGRHFYLKNRQGLYPCWPNPVCPVYGRETTRLILTESVIDAATLLQQPKITKDFEILALYGTNGLTDEHKEAIKELKQLQEIIFWFDGDAAGRSAIFGNKEKGIKGYGIELNKMFPKLKLSYVETPEGEDINSLNQSHSDKAVFTHLLKERIELGNKQLEMDFFFSSEKTEETLSTENGSDEKKNIPVSQPDQQQHTHQLPTVSREASERSRTAELNTSNPYKLSYITDTAEYYVKGGLGKQMDSLKVTLEIANLQGRKSRTKLDLYEDKQAEKTA
ncbi:MAG: CHC2 zinc finger domain-containing protein, partial [Patescibacteria group bacterium]